MAGPTREELLDALEEVVAQACTTDAPAGGGTVLDSMALSAYAYGLLTLAKAGRVVIKTQAGRRVIAQWVGDAS